jgi:hypothetical protein
MKMTIEVPDYSPEHGIRTEWEYGFNISSHIDDGSAIIKANRAGLVSLARHLLVLAQPEVPSGAHIHLDESNSLEDGSCELIIEKLPEGENTPGVGEE